MPDGISITNWSGQPEPALENLRAEQALLGAMLTKPELLHHLPPSFAAEHYADAWHTEVHRALVEVGQPGVPAALLVMQALAINDVEKRTYIANLLTSVVSASPRGIEPYAAVITDMHRRRGLLAAAEEMRTAALANGIGQDATAAIGLAQTRLEELIARAGDTRVHTSMNDAMDRAMAAADRTARGEGSYGLTTGFPSVDDMLGGLEPGTLTIIAGRPAMGKSAWGWQAAVNAARTGAGVMVISLEMSAIELGRRALCAVSGLPLVVLKKGKHGPYAEKLIRARQELNDLPLTIEDGSGLTAGMIALKARAAKRRHGLDLFMVDHLHIVRPEDGDVKQGATWAVGRISGAMKRLAKDHKCPALVLAQLNRGVEGRDDKRPGLADLRHAGDIEQDADAVGFVYRPEYYLGGEPEQLKGEAHEKYINRVTQWQQDKVRLKGKAELIFAKVRDGAPGTVPLLFRGETTSFSEPDYGE